MASGVQSRGETKERKPRTLRPRATASVGIIPIAVTDLTCHVVLGFEPRDFRAFVVSENVPHRRNGENGHRVIALVADCVAAIERASIRTMAPDDEPECSTTSDDILARIGRRRTA